MVRLVRRNVHKVDACHTKPHGVTQEISAVMLKKLAAAYQDCRNLSMG